MNKGYGETMIVPKDTSDILDKVSLKLEALKVMFYPDEKKVNADKENFVYDKNVILRTVFQNTNVGVSIVEHKVKDIGYPMHFHQDLTEYLIVTKGKFVFKTESFVRVLSRGECASIPSGLKHTMIPLEEGGEVLAICVPPEKAYEKVEGK